MRCPAYADVFIEALTARKIIAKFIRKMLLEYHVGFADCAH